MQDNFCSIKQLKEVLSQLDENFGVFVENGTLTITSDTSDEFIGSIDLNNHLLLVRFTPSEALSHLFHTIESNYLNA